MDHRSFGQIPKGVEDRNPCECVEKARMVLDRIKTEDLAEARVVCTARHHTELHGLPEIGEEDQLDRSPSSRGTEVEGVGSVPVPVPAAVDLMDSRKGQLNDLMKHLTGPTLYRLSVRRLPPSSHHLPLPLHSHRCFP
jgi:hypothetical protein